MLFAGFISHGIVFRSLSADRADRAEASVKWKFTFGKKHGVVLIMVKPVLKKFPMDGNFEPVLEILNKALKGRALVTETVKCDAYALIVSCGRDQSATIDLVASHRPPTSPLSGEAGASEATVGVGTGLSWIHSSTAGTWKVGSQPESTYTPLLELSMLKQGWRDWLQGSVTQRDSQELIDTDTPFASFRPPWNLLDEDGEEIPDPEVSLFRSFIRSGAETDFSDHRLVE
jgi:hypothetical protein